MPNWCSNSLHLKGEPQRIAEAAEQLLVKTENGYNFSFNHIVPMPAELNLDESWKVSMQQTWLRIAKRPKMLMTEMERDFRGVRDMNVCIPLFVSNLIETVFPDLKQYFSEKYDWDSLTVGEVFDHFEQFPDIAVRFGYEQPLAQRISENISKYGHPNWYDWRLANWGCKWDVDPECTFVTVEDSNIWISCETAWGPPMAIFEEMVKRYPDLTFDAKYLEEGNGVAGTCEGHEGVLFDYPVPDEKIREFAIDVFGYEYDDDEDEDE